MLEVGTRVRVREISGELYFPHRGWCGEVTGYEPSQIYSYPVKFDKGGSLCFKEEELEVMRETQPTGDAVNHPSHYTWLPNGLEVIDVTEHMGFCLGNVVKYVCRAGRKTADPIEDLRKARFYLNREIDRLEKRQGK